MTDHFWHDELQGLEPTAFPDLTGSSPSVRKTLTGLHITEGNLHTKLQDLVRRCRDLDSSVFVLCQVAWAKVLATYSGEQDLCFGCAEIGATSKPRSSSSSEILPLRVSLEPKSSNDSVLAVVSERGSRAKAHGPPSLDQVQDICSADVKYLYDTLLIFSHEGEHVDPSSLENLEYVRTRPTS